jgi:hypothetical protein
MSVSVLTVDSVTLNPDGVTAQVQGTIQGTATPPGGAQSVSVQVTQPPDGNGVHMGSGGARVTLNGSLQTYNVTIVHTNLHTGSASFTAVTSGSSGAKQVTGTVTIS